MFLLNPATFVGVIVVPYRWRRPQVRNYVPREHLVESLRAGLRYVRHSPRFFPVLIRVVAFTVFGSALWSLFPLVARRVMALDSFSYGALFGCLGCGSVAGALLSSKRHKNQPLDRILAGATVVFAAAALALAHLRQFAPLCMALFFGGIAWVTLMSGFVAAAQSAVPSWVRARATAIYILCFHVSMAGGSLLCGIIGVRSGPVAALDLAAVGVLLSLIVAVKYPLNVGDGLDLIPSLQWPESHFLVDPIPEAGPVLVTVEYCIDPARAREFGVKMSNVRLQPLREGIYRCGLFNDLENPKRYFETVLVESWADHLRQHERATIADRKLADDVRAFHLGNVSPRIYHLVNSAIAETNRNSCRA